jgi:hypothetical protein
VTIARKIYQKGVTEKPEKSKRVIRKTRRVGNKNNDMKRKSFYPVNGLMSLRNQKPENGTSKPVFLSLSKTLKTTAFAFMVIFMLVSLQSFGQSACQSQMFDIGYVYGTKGYQCVYEKYNNLNDGYSRKHEVYLSSGSYYELCAVCDNDCGDIDIKLYDGFGNLIAQDDTDDDIPVVGCRVISSGYFTVKVIMADCSDEPCSYGLAVFGR